MSKHQRRVSCLGCRRDITTGVLGHHPCFQTDVNEHPILYKYWMKKRQNTGYTFPLTGPQLITLLQEAGITPDQIGKGNGKYQLARINDEGNYEWGTCRFIPFEENMRERLPKSYAKSNRVKRTQRFRKKMSESQKRRYQKDTQ